MIRTFVQEPTVTGNAIMLSGFVAASINSQKDKLYSVTGIVAGRGELIVTNNVTKNRYRIRVEQISGTE